MVESVSIREYQLLKKLNVIRILINSYLAGEYETEQDGDGELAVAKEDDVEEVRVGWVLQEKPENIIKY